MRTLLICHGNELLDREGLSRWLASFSDLVGIIILRESKKRKWRRIKTEIARTGGLRFLDVIAMRFYYRLFCQKRDLRWEEERLAELRKRFGDVPSTARRLVTHSPNSAAAEAFIRDLAPDVMLARCKTLLAVRVFTIPSMGTFVMHPGICPEYRNAHGCFWALANGDRGKVGTTLLKVDRGVDTGPVYGYFSYDFDEVRESHMVITHRTVLDNLPQIAAKLKEIASGRAPVIDTRGRPSATWGQPWLTKYFLWKHNARRRTRHASHLDLVS